ncbi:response regulator [Rhodoferax sp. TS-BS-61-7]|uniref:ATP-binding response regulator n=1 Tax=Rhodoferax sp. TS-BS-61-7 TaxID=2094194 RepID=UPI001EFFEB4D|nr:response regulator [Rhodoferax sp. TS-BS-61-7]
MSALAFLVVDDFESMRKVTSNQLMSLGHSKIFTAKDGVQALKVLHAEAIDVVISDWNMPVMHGLDLLKAIRSDAKLRLLPFIMITAEVERTRIQEAIACGVSNILVKPYSAANLESRIARALQPAPALQLGGDGDDAQAAAPAAPASAAVAPRPTILVVDDTPDNLHLLSALFKDDYKVRVASNGEKALAICHSDTPPDLVLLDIMMPGMDGFEVAQRMREHPSSEHIPVIFVTAMTDNDARLKGLSMGAVDFVTKPVDPDVLKPRVRNFLRYVELHKQLQADYDSMQEAARLREDVEHITRHDLKGSLAGVLGLVQSLAQDSRLSPDQTAQLRLTEQTTLQVLDMINLSSELYKIETGRFTLQAQPVKLAEVLSRLVEIANSTYAGKPVVVELQSDSAPEQAPPQALGDAMLCYSLFQNLIKNACEASPAQGRVLVALNGSDPLQVLIHNQGAVPVDIQERFFHKFVTHGKPGGTGLGTYSAKLLATAQGGDVALDVSDPQGTSITVTLPRVS